ncbi:MAG: hypothetical protein Q9207_001260 [Kuettlingeria erythrocarpa]
MSEQNTLLNFLQSKTRVDCDTLDSEVARKYKNLVDCTSNQALAYAELLKPHYGGLLEESIRQSRQSFGPFGGVSRDELAVEIAMVKLSLRVAPHICGMVHMQTNPRYAYDTEETLSSAFRIVTLYKSLDTAFDASRICVKIPCTFEGLQACRVLHASGVKTLATTVFTIEQAVLAADAGCHYIAPYLNALKAQVDDSYHDPNPDFNLCVSAQRYFEHHHLGTQVLAASFSSTEDILRLAGIHHMTVPPPLLEKLDDTPASAPKPESLFQADSESLPEISVTYLYHKDFFLKAIERGQYKLSQAIEIFCDMQTKLESLVENMRKDKGLDHSR